MYGLARQCSTSAGPTDSSRETIGKWVDAIATPLLRRMSDTCMERDLTGAPVAHEDIEQAARCGLLSASMPRAMGGLEIDMQSWGRVLEHVGRTCEDGSFALLLSLFPAVANTIFASRNNDLIERYAVPCSFGTRLVAFAYTEENDAFSLSSTMRRQGDDYIIDGAKVMVTGGAIADAYMTYVVNERHDDVAVVIIDRNSPGLRVDPIDTMGLRGAGLAALSFDAVRVSHSQIMHDCNGLDHVQAFLNPRRAILSCAPIGRMERLLSDCIERLSGTVRHGRPLTSMQMVQARLGKMQMSVHVSKTLIDRVLFELDQGTTNQHFDELVSTVKHQVTEHAIAVALEALGLMGGRGYARSTPVERYLRDFCGLLAGAGAQDILQVNLGLLAIGRHSTNDRGESC